MRFAGDIGIAVRFSGPADYCRTAHYHTSGSANFGASLFNSGLAYLLNRQVRSPHCVAGPSALIGASNFFGLTVTTTIALFGFESSATLATVVNVLIEVPIMLVAVRVVNQSQAWYERRNGVIPYEQCGPSNNSKLVS